MRITPSRPLRDRPLRGLVIGGGSDVDPLHYGEEPLPVNDDDDARDSALDWLVALPLAAARLVFARHSSGDYDPERDRMEQTLIRAALYGGLPMLGICRGAQLLNVTLGGSLHQRIDHFYAEGTSNVRSVLPRKTVNVCADSRLAALVGAGRQRVNALHGQSINALGDGVRVVALEANGVVQAVERTEGPLVLGVQWHPEYLPQLPAQQALFRALVTAARERSH